LFGNVIQVILTPIISLFFLAAQPEQAIFQLDAFGSSRPCRPATVLIGLSPRARESSATAGAPGSMDAAITASGGRVTGRCPQLGILRVTVGPGEELSAARGRLRGLDGARYVEPDWMGEGGVTVNDTFFARQWHLDRIEAPSAWDITRGSANVIVAVLDTGIDRDHPEFQGRALQGHDFVNDDDDPTNDHDLGHGLHTTGLLAANADNGFGVAGVDHHCRILPVKVLDQNNSGTDWNLIQGITYAVDQGARVISMSLINYPESDALADALRYAREHGVVLVACAGNKGAGDADVSWPGASPLCITVGATDALDQRAAFSGTGQSLDVMAPGDKVLTVSLDWADGSNTFSGCSAATPVAAGVVSLLLSVDPTMTPEEVQEVLQKGADDEIGGPDDKPGWDPSYGWGRVNARRSLALLGNRFVRGDTNSDGDVDISDAIFILSYLFDTGKPLSCRDAADANDDGLIDLSDPVQLLDYLFLGGAISGTALTCSLDLTSDTLECTAGCSR
jgi:subtilisin family serine protease